MAAGKGALTPLAGLWLKGVRKTRKSRFVYNCIQLLVVVSALCVTSATAFGAALSYTYIETTVLPELTKATGFATGRTTPGGNAWHLAAVRDGNVLLYEISDRTTGAYLELNGFPSPAVSVAFADYDGDGRDDLWVGSAGSGNVYVYSLGTGYPLLGKSAERTWAKITQLITADFDGDAFADVAALTETGTVFVFLHRAAGLVQVWRSGAREGKVQHLLAADLDNDGRSELIVARDPGYAAVWRWTPTPESTTEINLLNTPEMQAPRLGAASSTIDKVEPKTNTPQPAATPGKLTLMWEYDTPRGVIQSVVAADFQKDGSAELLLATSQNRIYIFGTDGAGSLTLRNEQENATLAGGLRSVPSSSSGTLLFGAQGDTISIWQRKGDSGWQFETAWQSDFNIKFTNMIVAGDRLITVEANGVHLFKQVPRNYIRITLNGKPYTELLADPIVIRNEVYLTAKDWAAIYNLPVPLWHQAGRITITQGLQHLVATPGSKESVINTRQITLKNEPLNKEGLVFLPAEAINLLSGGVTWQPRTRVLTLR